MATKHTVVAGTVVALATSGLVATASAATAQHQKIATVQISLGRVLSNPAGRVIYLFEKDTTNKSNCNATCRIYWPPVMSTGAPVAGAHVAQSHLGRTAAGQVTYYGHPLYYYLGDKKPRQARGEGSTESGAKWYVIGTNGRAIDND